MRTQIHCWAASDGGVLRAASGGCGATGPAPPPPSSFSVGAAGAARGVRRRRRRRRRVRGHLALGGGPASRGVGGGARGAARRGRGAARGEGGAGRRGRRRRRGAPGPRVHVPRPDHAALRRDVADAAPPPGRVRRGEDAAARRAAGGLADHLLPHGLPAPRRGRRRLRRRLPRLPGRHALPRGLPVPLLEAQPQRRRRRRRRELGRPLRARLLQGSKRVRHSQLQRLLSRPFSTRLLLLLRDARDGAGARQRQGGLPAPRRAGPRVPRRPERTQWRRRVPPRNVLPRPPPPRDALLVLFGHPGPALRHDGRAPRPPAQLARARLRPRGRRRHHLRRAELEPLRPRPLGAAPRGGLRARRAGPGDARGRRGPRPRRRRPRPRGLLRHPDGVHARRRLGDLPHLLQDAALHDQRRLRHHRRRLAPRQEAPAAHPPLQLDALRGARRDRRQHPLRRVHRRRVLRPGQAPTRGNRRRRRPRALRLPLLRPLPRLRRPVPHRPAFHVQPEHDDLLPRLLEYPEPRARPRQRLRRIRPG
ncbi:hypothetical protein AURANDRAFT_71584, partial [Aureococcus anophagefferens]